MVTAAISRGGSSAAETTRSGYRLPMRVFHASVTFDASFPGPDKRSHKLVLPGFRKPDRLSNNCSVFPVWPWLRHCAAVLRDASQPSSLASA